MIETLKTITSDTFVGQVILQNILSDTTIHATVLQTLLSNAFCGRETLHDIESETVVFITTAQTITSDTAVRSPVIFYGSVQAIKLESDTKYGGIGITNPIPSAPTGLVVVDMGRGDAISLNWVSPAFRFNVYTKVGIVYTKINPNVLENVTTYIAGGLASDVLVNFVVRALNGLGQESGDSNIAIATPTYNENLYRFSSPTYVININGTPYSQAILADVQLGYGSSFSTASFTLPVDPRLGGYPNLDSIVEILINGRRVFKGYITTRGNAIDQGNGLRITYLCHSKLLDFTKYTLYSTDIDRSNTTYNYFYILPNGTAAIFNQANANVILNKLGIPNGPTDYPGEVDLTDQTNLSAAELVLSNIGNYKIYYDMINEVASIYRFGSHGYTVREFQFGKNIIAYDVQTSHMDVVNKLRLIGAPKRITTKKMVTDAKWEVNPDGSSMMSFTIQAKNISDVQVYGWCKEKPIGKFDTSIQVGISDFATSFPGNLFNTSLDLSTPQISEAFRTSFFNPAAQNEVIQKDEQLYPAMRHCSHYQSMRQPLGAKIVYTGTAKAGPDQAKVYITQAPLIWGVHTKSGQVDDKVIGKRADVELGSGSTYIAILLDYISSIGPTEVEYSYEIDPPTMEIGSGTPEKTITDEQYGIIQDEVNNYDNTLDTLARMQARLNGEFARLHKDNTSGTITILGDETLDLRSSVLVNGQLLDISGITHSFQNGFLTTVTLTNEPFFRNIILPQSLIRPAGKDAERVRKLKVDTYYLNEINKLHLAIANQKAIKEKEAKASAADHVIQG